MKKLEQIKATGFLWAYTFLKLPLLAWIRPRILEMNDTTTVLKVPLFRRTKNHLNVMYFGALAMGAEAAVAICAVQEIRKSGQRVDFLFKDFQADFLKRAEGDVHFICEEGRGVRDLIDQALKTGERQNRTFRSYAVVPSVDPRAVIGEFKVTLSVKHRPKS